MDKIIKECKRKGIEEGENEEDAKVARLAAASIFKKFTDDEKEMWALEREKALGTKKAKKKVLKEIKSEDAREKKKKATDADGFSKFIKMCPKPKKSATDRSSLPNPMTLTKREAAKLRQKQQTRKQTSAKKTVSKSGGQTNEEMWSDDD
eukprot:Tbor_TRINITY_DN5787_c0_g1::TRINITY_DN5787_c0_g1_i1::g.20855::m.20855